MAPTLRFRFKRATLRPGMVLHDWWGSRTYYRPKIDVWVVSSENSLLPDRRFETSLSCRT